MTVLSNRWRCCKGGDGFTLTSLDPGLVLDRKSMRRRRERERSVGGRARYVIRSPCVCWGGAYLPSSIKSMARVLMIKTHKPAMNMW